MSTTIPALDPVSSLLDTDVVMITHSNGTTEKMTIANFLLNVMRKTPFNHNIVRMSNGKPGKDITAYYQDGSLWRRLTGNYISGSSGAKYGVCEEVCAGDYFQMSRAITCPDSYNGETGSDWVTIAEINGLMRNGDSDFNTPHLVMVPGKGTEGKFHFGRHRMNPTNTTANGYTGSEMHTDVLGAVASSGSTASGATINQQLYAEFGSHLKTTRELLTNAMDANSTKNKASGLGSGASNGWAWTACQAVLMSEVEVFGSVVWSSSGYDTGNANKQFAIFNQFKAFINNRSAYYWLKDIVSSSLFALVNSGGYAYFNGASNTGRYVRPRFVIGA